MIPAWMLPHHLLIHGPDIVTIDGPVPGPPERVRAYIEHRAEVVRDQHGAEHTSPTFAIVDRHVDPGTTVTDDRGRTTHVLTIEDYAYPGAPSHTVLRLA